MFTFYTVRGNIEPEVLVMNKNYEKIKELSTVAFDFVEKLLKEDVENGRYDLSDGIFVNVMTYETKKRSEALFEAHKKYIDIQIILEGSEIISVEPVEVMHQHKCVEPFGDGDIELYEVNSDCVDYVLNKGDFLILYPEDGHMPSICVGEPETVKKAVFKVPV